RGTRPGRSRSRRSRRTPWRPSWRSASPVICSGTHYPCDVVISIVVPIHNETETLAELHRRLTTVLAELAPYEVVLVDDGSTDDSWERMLAVAAGDRHVRLLRLSRNFGHQAALTAGIDAARGEAVVVMDGDLQDPPELIPTF